MVFVAAERHNHSVEAGHAIVVIDGKLLKPKTRVWRPFCRAELIQYAIEFADSHYLGLLDQQACVVGVCDLGILRNRNLELIPLRAILGEVSDEQFHLAGRALQILRWRTEHQFCGTCGAKTRLASSDRSMVCDACELRFYPRISPCVIGLVTRGNECLLARGQRLPSTMYSALAGFVEAGESAEQALAREVMEEVGLRIGNIRYAGSQSWPFPGQLMLGFTAEYIAGEINIDEQEILAADWFAKDALPTIPPSSTLSGQLIAHFVSGVS